MKDVLGKAIYRPLQISSQCASSWRSLEAVSLRGGSNVQFVDLMSVLQLHTLEHAIQGDFWSLENMPWFAVALPSCT